jgi:hypothetical protein
MLALCNIRLDCGLNLTAPPSCQRHDILITPHSQCGVDEALDGRRVRDTQQLQIHRDIPFVLAGADVDHLHLDVLLGDEDADVIADGCEIANQYGKNLFVQHISHITSC